ncbi:MAG: nicotinate phosphoribosyltransferase [Prolixibacteraceae bacterium]|jgi:nicotinate phosphoribosyltransferase|nr:nicotinate phosphoribosyltransferase [Prolixibacteraceae bacterium]MBT6004884.1 nicotinate phosphoribosyltransferase [Prolixibacteraceae bacterium]MBT6763334.1 nicotinate phosphoribosyltransferase [Prolixibacteraceae bacterium]MBT6997886.1 nicotinate phosphoribosyltransferase [Prolixibacteraceae bacterium]MBT7395606.1 nicotinate phosphoribosyltransferase [Prolixibacteraceae bacterium]
MATFFNSLGLYTDFYELSMAQGYFYCGKKEDTSTFDYYFRTNPFKGGFTVFAGLQDFLDLLSNFTFGDSDLEYLEKHGFKPEFLKYLKNFKFLGNIFSMQEGEIVFPNVPILRVEGNIIECQLIESLLLNILNFESLIATKAFRIKLVTGKKIFSDFGLRRAQGFGAIHASRAAVIGGATSTSNVLAGKMFGIPVSGTQAHSWVQSFDSELEAFRTYADLNQGNTVLLVDTFDTLNSGVPNAIKVAKEMEENGHRLKAIRLDSGDLAYLSKKARKMLDEAGLKSVKIIASNQLNEYVIKSLLKDQNAAIDAFGIGTELVTGKSDAALDGVYKLVEINGKPKMKISENIEKITQPCKKQVYRFFDNNGNFFRDGIFLQNENIEETDMIYHPVYPEKNTRIKNLTKEALLQQVVSNGKIMLARLPLAEIHKYLVTRAGFLPNEHKRFISPHLYKVGISKKLLEFRNMLSNQIKLNIELNKNG